MVYAQHRILLENKTHKGLWDFEIQTDHLILVRRPYLVIVKTKTKQNKKKQNCRIVDFSIPVDHRVKLKESEKRDKYLDLARELKKKTMKHENDGDTSCNWRAWFSH